MKQTLLQTNRQSGFVLIIALIALAALSMAGLGLMRAITADTAIAGNLAFRQSTINSGDTAIDNAVGKIVNDLLKVDASTGNPYSWANQDNYYRATLLKSEDPKGNALCTSTDLDCIKANGIPNRLLSPNVPQCTTAKTTVSYVIDDSGKTGSGNCAHVFVERLCNVAGEATAIRCILLSSQQEDSGKYAETHGSGEIAGAKPKGNKVAVRVTVRIEGPRGTTTFLQALVGQKMV